MGWNPMGSNALVVQIVLNVANLLITMFFLYKLIRGGKWSGLQFCGLVALVLTLLMTASRYVFNYVYYSFLAGSLTINTLVASLIPNTLLRVFQYISLLHFMYLVSLAPMIKAPSKFYVAFHYGCAIIAPLVSIGFYLAGFIQNFTQTAGFIWLLICFLCIIVDQLVTLIVFTIPILNHRKKAQSLITTTGISSAESQGQRKVYVALRFRWYLAVLNYLLTLADMFVILAHDNQWINGYGESLFMWGQAYICLWISVFGLQPVSITSSRFGPTSGMSDAGIISDSPK